MLLWTEGGEGEQQITYLTFLLPILLLLLDIDHADFGPKLLE